MSIQGRRVAPAFSTEPDDQQPHRARHRGGGGSRHGCLTAWLVLLIVTVSFSAIAFLLVSLNPTSSNEMGALGLLFLPLYIWYVVCLVALFYWRKWGFWGIIAAQTLDSILILVLALPWPYALKGWTGVIFLYGMLHLGGHRKAWPRLR